MLLSLATAALTLLVCPPAPAAAPEPIQVHYVPADLEPTTSGTWLLTWDDQVDAAMSEAPHTLMLELRFVGDRVSGRFAHPLRSDALLTGTTIGLDQSAPLLRLRQDEPEYTCIYDAQRSDLGWWGTWRDTKGRAGDFRLQPIVRLIVGLNPPPITIAPDLLNKPYFRAPWPHIPHAEIELPKFHIDVDDLLKKMQRGEDDKLPASDDVGTATEKDGDRSAQ